MAHVATWIPSLDQPGNQIRRAWDTLSRVPGGPTLFNGLLRWLVPYTGALGARVVEVREGYAEVVLHDRRAVRNHLSCVHAVALANLAELTGNLALAYGLPDDARFIVSGLHMQYHKKARGTLTARAHPPIPKTNARAAFEVKVAIHDSRNELVCSAVLDTLVGPKPGA